MLKQAVKMLVGHWYENREPAVIGTIVTQLPFAVQSIINLNKYPECIG
jgi:hypothetical protein